MQVSGAAFVLAFVIVQSAGCFQSAAGDAPDALESALDYLAAVPPGTLAPYRLEAAVAAGLDPALWPRGEPILSQVLLPDNETSYQRLLRPAFALSRLGVDAPRSGEIRERLLAGYDGAQFGDPALLSDDIFALWALAALVPDWSQPPWNAMADNLVLHQSSGGWSWSTSGTPDTDLTGMALSALAAVPPQDGAQNGSSQPFGRADRAAAVVFLASVAVPGGGFAAAPGSAANCDSTVWGIRAASFVDAPLDENAWPFLLGLQRSDGGFAYVPDDLASNALCTAEAATLLADAKAGRIAGPEPPS